jgi:hypothetical protein
MFLFIRSKNPHRHKDFEHTYQVRLSPCEEFSQAQHPTCLVKLTKTRLPVMVFALSSKTYACMYVCMHAGIWKLKKSSFDQALQNASKHLRPDGSTSEDILFLLLKIQTKA